MSPTGQRIAIAEACMLLVRAPNFTDENLVQCGALHALADYPNDLDAMHAAVMSQPNETKWNIFIELAGIVDPEIPAACATAAEWAEAFLRTKGKWDDSK